MRSHIVPQYYLRGFVGIDSKIWTYRKGSNVTHHSATTKTAVEKGFYSPKNEQYLANKIEDPATAVIQKIREKQSIAADEKVLMARYLTSFLIRVPFGKQRLDAESPKAFDSVFSEENLTEILGGRKPSPAQRKKFQQLRQDWERNPIEEFWQPLLQQELSGSRAALTSMVWQFLTFDAEPAFITSDNPVFYFKEFGIGGNQLSEVTFPISKNIALWATWRNDLTSGFFSITKDIVDEINCRTASIATRDIYFPLKKQWIIELVNQPDFALHRITTNDALQHILQSL